MHKDQVGCDGQIHSLVPFFFFHLLIPIEGVQQSGAFPSAGWKAGKHPGQVASLSQS